MSIMPILVNPYILPLHESPLTFTISKTLNFPPLTITSLLSLLQTHPFPYLLRYRPHLIPLTDTFTDVEARQVHAIYVRFIELSLSKTKANLFTKITNLPPSPDKQPLLNQLEDAINTTSLTAVTASFKQLSPIVTKNGTIADKELWTLPLGSGFPLAPYVHKLYAKSPPIKPPYPIPLPSLTSISHRSLLYITLSAMLQTPVIRATLREGYATSRLVTVA